MRELFKALSELENSLVDMYGVSLNEAMVLCSIGRETVAASTIVERTGMKASHTSKVIGGAERKGLLTRELGEKDKRQMYFSLTEKARECLSAIRKDGVEMPEVLLPLFNSYEMSEECESLS